MIYSWLAAFLLFSLGSVLAYLGLRLEALLALIILLAFCICVPQQRKELIIVCCLFVFGFMNIYCRSLGPADVPDLGEQTLVGVVANYPNLSSEKTRFILESKNNNDYLQRIQVYCEFEADLQKGDQIAIRGKLIIPNRPGNPGEFDYHTYLIKKHIFYIMSVEKKEDLEVIAASQGAVRFFNAYRNQTIQTVYNILPEEEAGIFLGMLLGIIENMEEEQYELYQKTGIVHIFSVSGLHIGFLILFFAYVGAMMGVSPRILFYGTLTILLAYGTLTGWPVPVQRAVIMASLALLAGYQGREGGLGNSLGLAALIILLLDPYALFSISFQLSFMATWGLVFLYPAMKKYFSFNHLGWDIILIPLCAQLAVIPLIAYYFNLFTPSGLISNILISYLSGFIVILGFLALLFAYLPGLAVLFLLPAGLSIQLLKAINNLIANMPGSFIWVKTPDEWLFLLYYGGILLMAVTLALAMERKFLLFSTALITIVIIIICLPASVYKQGILQVAFIDVGQGDSILLKTPQGKFILIDGGGSNFTAVGERKVLPYLRHRGIRELYMVINSHPDQDHYQGLLETVRKVPFRNLLLPASLIEAEEYETIKSLANMYNAPVLSPINGQKFNIDGVVFTAFYALDEEGASNYNDQSLVLACNMGGFSALFPGDLEAGGLQQITDNCGLEKALLLKVPHHGSKNSLCEDFYRQLDPRLAIISAGQNNMHGHPHQEVLNYLEMRKIKTLRTDQNGLICLESDGSKLNLSCFKS